MRSMHRTPLFRAHAGLRLAAFAALAVGVAATWAAPARAACTNDVDCPTTTCGGEVCQWSASGHNCMPAGTDPQGTDGWCTADTDCKCMGEGATCVSPHCTFTLPKDGGTATADSGTASSSSGASSSGVTGSSGGYSSGAATGSSSGGGTSSGTGSSTGGTLPDADVSSGSTSTGNSGGCTVSTTARGTNGAAFGLACAAALTLTRRRRRAIGAPRA